MKWWFLDDKENHALVRKNSDGSVIERLSYTEADGYFCMSSSDVEALLNWCKQSP